MMSTATIESRVRAGATLLDANVPGWYELINPDRLVMNDCIGCVLGQTFGNYVVGCDELGITAWARSQAVEFGFHSSVDLAWEELDRLPLEEQDKLIDADRAEYAALKACWLAEIDQRLKPETLTPTEEGVAHAHAC